MHLAPDFDASLYAGRGRVLYRLVSYLLQRFQLPNLSPPRHPRRKLPAFTKGSDMASCSDRAAKRRAMHGQQRLANHGQQCLANPRGEPCTGRSETQHPYMPEIGCCFRCAERQQVMRESARLLTEGEPVVSDKCVETKFSLADYQHPVGKVGGLVRETLCALCTLPANGDEMLECRGSRDGTACKLVWHKSCHEMWCSRALSSGAAAPPSGDVL